MRSPRWTKLLRDLAAERRRVLLMGAAIAVSLMAVGTVLGAYAILTREIAVNYLGTRPASATLELPGGVDAALLSEVRARPELVEAEARDVILARARVDGQWRRLLLFVVDDFADLRLATFRPVEGAWPPPAGTMLIERTAVSGLGAGVGGAVVVRTPHGEAREVPVTGLVHDPALAPAWQERSGYGYITRATLAVLGEPPVLRELRIDVRAGAGDVRAIEATAEQLGRWLGERGHPVHEIRVPPPGQHPHGTQMRTILVMLLAFTAMALVLSAVLVATSLAAMLARQVREIGVMKTIGARTRDIALHYAVMVAIIGIASVVAAVPASIAAARAMSAQIATMLNFTLTSVAIPGWVYAVQLAAGVLVPLLVAAVPIARASRTSVRRALDQHGVSADVVRPRFSTLPRPLRNLLRRPARLALTLGLLAVGGAMFMTALNVSRAWDRNLDKVYETRFYDVEIRLHEPAPPALAERVARVPGVRRVERWGASPIAFARPGRIDVSRTYPDGGHGSLMLLGPPPDTRLVRLPLRAGRWLEPGDTDAVVLNHAAAAQSRARVGSTLAISLDGQVTDWRVVGIVEEIGAAGVAYVTNEAFARVAGTGDGARMLRIQTDVDRIAAIDALERVLDAEGVGVASAMPLAELRTAVGDHIVVLIRMLMAMATILAIVGALGLASTMGISVVERTRELGVLKAIGAPPSRIGRMILAESILLAATSWALAVSLALPLSAFVDWLIGMLGFLAPLPLVVSPAGIALWLALVVVVSVVATALPARRAAALSVRDALAYV